ncbi:hypothetical protein BABINDRAFT_9010 [Babjeviella inositovora NRRL Y-12698]|uniref:AB hydrolase-1 domain-containing protein n=1 Tax=Babjeviella inositovora NRRL Y-12698 TaxID=984486 RepID=A0A1E3QM48_9ASCO|nr:uncharacterized protein BABINDRAFT_9010 [Babjeviella inositovora NRRL Y-12698]ODQ78773.1 hypothetical protein BABINDRAFT_9010 [Babjeviella inositovora NRRL Y-12698]
MIQSIPWGYNANLTLHTHEDSVKLPMKAGDATAMIPLRKLVQNLLSVKPGYVKLNPYLFNGTLQTMYYSKEFNKHQIFYGRQLVKFQDKGTASADFVILPESKADFSKKSAETIPEGWPRMNRNTRFLSTEEVGKLYSDMAPEKPIVVILHGLGGGSHEPLVRAIADRLYSGNKYDVVVLNSRGCSRTKISTPELFNALSTGDIREFVANLKEAYPNKPVYAVGLSFGGTILGNFLGEDSDKCLVDAACVISAPWDLVDSAYHIGNSYSGKHMFGPAVASFLHRLIKNNKQELSENWPDFFTPELLNRKFQSTIEFDNLITAPLVGFHCANDYYREGSPVNRIFDIHTPTLILNSTDDPVVSVRLPYDEVRSNPWLCMVETDLGGHLGYMKPGNESWTADLISDYFEEFTKTVNMSVKPESTYKRRMDWKNHS